MSIYNAKKGLFNMDYKSIYSRHSDCKSEWTVWTVIDGVDENVNRFQIYFCR